MYIFETWFILNSLICFYLIHSVEEQAKDQIDLFEIESK
jgi:hypothetical protein